MSNATIPGHHLCAVVRNAAVFALALAAACAGINSLLPSLPVLGISDKLDYLRAHRGEIDTVFLGSSRTYHAFDPTVFDRELAPRGVTMRSFNFGIDGMRPPESFYVLRELLKLRLPLRWLFIELVDIHPKVNAANVGTARYVHWHDWHHTAMVLRYIARSRGALPEKAAQMLVHARCFLARLSNIGRGPEWLGAKLRGPQKRWRFVPPWEGHAGFEAQTTPVLSGAERTDYEGAVALIEKGGLAKTAVPPLLAAALRDAASAVRASGARPLFVIPPTIVGRENLTGLAEAGIDAPVIAFTDPRRHPGLFRAANHCDVEHLNAAGAAEFSRALAEEFAARFSPQGSRDAGD